VTYQLPPNPDCRAIRHRLLHSVRKTPDKTPLSSQIFKDRKYYPYFKDCIGALDGTHIACHVLTLAYPRYQNRKGYLSQNVLAICNFELLFLYVLPGWEGSAHNQRVLSDALYWYNLNILPGKYYLGDAGYTNSEYCIVLYRGVRYHLKEQRLASQRYVILVTFVLIFILIFILDLRMQRSFLIYAMYPSRMLLSVFLGS
jgi:hypothetical protein